MTHTENTKRHHLVGPLALWEMKRVFQIEFLEPGNYYGIESRKEVLLEGEKELSESNLAHKKPVLVTTNDLDSLRFGVEFPYIWAFSALIHMNYDCTNPNSL